MPQCFGSITCGAGRSVVSVGKGVEGAVGVSRARSGFGATMSVALEVATLWGQTVEGDCLVKYHYT